MRAGRLLSILMLLQSRGRMSAQALADEVEVSVRTVYKGASPQVMESQITQPLDALDLLQPLDERRLILSLV